jgi:hypothetical protein
VSTTAELGTSGIILNATDALGCRWGWSGDEPWTPGPSPRVVSGENATDHGSWDATEFYDARTYAIEGYVIAPDHLALHQAKSRLFSAINLGFDLRVIEPGFDRTGRFRRNGEPSWAEINNTTARFSAPVWAADPRAYSTTLRTASTAFPTSSGGLTLPFTLPLTIPATVATGLLNLTNDGTEDAYPVFRFDGPVSDPGVVNVATGQSWRLKLDVGDGEFVTVDTATHQVLAQGDVNGTRRNTWSGDWFGLTPGPNALRFIGQTAGPGAQLSVSYRSAWI